MKFNGFLAAACVAAAGVLGLASCGSGQKAEKGAQVAEQKAPEHAVTVLEKGAVITPEESKLVVIDFNATWCGPCRQFAPTFEAVAEEMADKALFYSVDVDQHPELAQKYGVQSIPMVVYLKPTGQYESTVGVLSKEDFTATIQENL